MNNSKTAPSQTMAVILARIRDGYKDMTPTYRAVAEYVLHHHQELAFASAARVGKLAGISPATVVRFAEHLGLSGFTELQGLARQALRQDVDTVSQLKRTTRGRDPHSILEMGLRADIANLERALDQLAEPSFARAVEILTGARTIHLVGLRSTFGLVRHLEFYLGWIGRRAAVLRPGIGDVPEQIMKVAPGDASLGFSFRRYTRETVEILAATKKAGATTIAVTDSELSPLAEHADVALIVPVKYPAFFDSRVAALSLMNALMLGIALATRKQTLEALRRHEDAWVQHETYVNENFRGRFNAEIEAFAARGGSGRAASRVLQRLPRARKRPAAKPARQYR